MHSPAASFGGRAISPSAIFFCDFVLSGSDVRKITPTAAKNDPISHNLT